MVLGKSDPLWLGASCSDIVFLEPPNPVVGKLTAATQKGTPSLGVVWGEGEGKGEGWRSIVFASPTLVASWTNTAHPREASQAGKSSD